MDKLQAVALDIYNFFNSFFLGDNSCTSREDAFGLLLQKVRNRRVTAALSEAGQLAPDPSSCILEGFLPRLSLTPS